MPCAVKVHLDNFYGTQIRNEIASRKFLRQDGKRLTLEVVVHVFDNMLRYIVSVDGTQVAEVNEIAVGLFYYNNAEEIVTKLETK